MTDRTVEAPQVRTARQSSEGGPGRTLRRRFDGLLAWAERHPAWTITLLMLTAAAPHATTAPISWRFFRTAGELVLSGTALDTYAAHPELQFGPITFLAAAPLSAIPGAIGSTVAVIVMLGLGVATLVLLRAAVPITAARAGVWWLATAVAVLAWAELAVRYGHLDDALALTLIAAALYCYRHGHAVAATVLLALSVDAKPWAVPLVAVVLLLPRRQRAPHLALWAVVVAVAWLPFLLFSLHSVNAAAFTIPIDPGSGLTLLPFSGTVTPWWCRPAQLAGGLALALVAARRRSLAGIVLATFAVRLALDPSVKGYYDVEIILATLLCDLALHRARLPWLTLTAAATVFLPTYLLTSAPVAHAWLRTAGLAGLAVAGIILAAGAPASASADAADGQFEGDGRAPRRRRDRHRAPMSPRDLAHDRQTEAMAGKVDSVDRAPEPVEDPPPLARR